MAKKRVDVLLVEQGLAESRQKAQALIMAGQVYAGERRCDKPGLTLDERVMLEVRGQTMPYVSRGGLKLEKAMKCFPITLTGKISADIGASTGGFTDCMLRNGAGLVYAVDVGKNQLDVSLRENEKVVSLEKTDIRTVQGKISERADFISIDVSFISLKKVLPFAVNLLKEQGTIVALIKPQFEVGKSGLGKKGIVKNPRLRENAVNEIKDFSLQTGLKVNGIIESPITGGDGNVEYLICLSR